MSRSRPTQPSDDPSQGCTYPRVNPSDIAFVEIFPPVGIARVGDSGTLRGARIPEREIEYFYTPEVPNHVEPPPDFKFRDKYQRIKRQAARFRVYAYDADGKILGEINENNSFHLEWTVDVANAKAATTIFKGMYQEKGPYRNPDVQPDLPEQQRTHLIVRPAPATISGKEQAKTLTGRFQGSLKDEMDALSVTLGEARTDENGRLVFISGSGYACSVGKNKAWNPDPDYPDQPDITSEFDSIDWIDTTCDGIVSVKFYHESDKTKKFVPARHRAHVVSGPPDFAWGINTPTSLYDIVEDVYNKASPSFVPDSTVQFYRDIWPVLSQTYNMSWVNNDAFQGHGPNGKGNFLLLEDQLKDRSPEQKGLRQHIFSRLRMPDYINPDQASTKFMPRLSGDGGDAIEPGTIQTMSAYPKPYQRFASLTALQYDRFKRWRDGDFKTDPYPMLDRKTGARPTRIEDVDLALQPEYLTRAHLETTIGDPLYPGIEAGWVAKISSTYDFTVDASLKPPFRLTHKLKSGDMTKGLSLPWQTDFSQCNTHWWPSARPDDVVPEQLYKQIKDKTPPAQLAGKLEETTRRPWTRIFRETDEDQEDFYPGCTDMVRHWQRLGFIAKIQPAPGVLPVFIETERNLPVDSSDFV